MYYNYNTSLLSVDAPMSKFSKTIGIKKGHFIFKIK